MDTSYDIHHSVVYLKHLRIKQYNLPLWCSSLFTSVWIFVWFISIWRCIYTVRSQGNRKGLNANASSGSRGSLFITAVPQRLHVYDGPFALACWLCSMQMESMYSGAEGRLTSVQSFNGTTLDPVYVLKLSLKLQPGFQHTNWILVSSPELIGLKWND